MSDTTTKPALPPAPGYLTSSFRIFDLSVGEMLWSRRTIFMLLVVGAPVVIALFLRILVGLGLPLFEQRGGGGQNAIRVTGPAIFGMMIWLLYLRFIVPVLGVFYGTSLMADEVEDKTITYLFTRPIPRGAVLIGKYLAYMACTGFVVLPSVVVVYLLIVPMQGSLGSAFPDLLKDLALLAIGLAVYGAVFAFVGARFKRPLLIGLIFIFAWEQGALMVPGYLKRFTVAYYIQGLVPHAMPSNSIVSLAQGIFREIPTLGTTVFWLAVIWALSLGFGAWIVARKEYVLEQ
jgi:ABC-2 type transport system permease protein